MSRARWLTIRKELSPRQGALLWVASFVLPLALWSVVSYVPFIWHPFVTVTEPGGVDYFQPGMLVEKETFAEETRLAAKEGRVVPRGSASNPIYLPPPHEVAKALYAPFRTPP